MSSITPDLLPRPATGRLSGRITLGELDETRTMSCVRIRRRDLGNHITLRVLLC